MFEDLKAKLKSELEVIAGQTGIDIVEVKLVMVGRTMTIQIFADKENGGITIGECSILNKKFIGHIDQERIIDSEYTIEVSSPGLEWPLKTDKDFRRVLNRKVRFHLSEVVEGKIEHSGIIEEVDSQAQHVKVRIKEKAIYILLSKINKAVQSIE